MSDQSAEKTTTWTLEAKLDQYMASLVKGQETTKAAADYITGQFNTIGNGINTLIGLSGKLSGILGGGFISKEAVSETVAWDLGAAKLAKTLGDTTEKASVLKVALRTVGVDQDLVTSASMRMANTFNKNSQAFQEIGVDIDGMRKSGASNLDIMLATIQALGQYKGGMDVNAAAMSIFGRSWGELQQLQKLTTQGMKEAEETAKRLHLIVGPEGAARAKEYKKEMAELDLVKTSLAHTAGTELLGALVELGALMQGPATSAAHIFATAVHEVHDNIRLTIKAQEDWEASLQRNINSQSVNALTLLMAVKAAATGNYSQIPTILQAGYQAGKDIKDDDAHDTGWEGSKTKKPWTPPDKEKEGRQLAADDARLKAVLAGIKAREEAEKEGNANLIALEDFSLKTSLNNQDEYNQNKYEIQRKGLLASRGFLDEEIAAIRQAEQEKLAHAKKPEEKTKITAQTQAEIMARLAAQDKLDQEIYRLDTGYQAQTIAEENALFKSYMDRVYELRQKEKDLVLAGIREVASARSKEIDQATSAEERMANEIITSSNETRKLLLQSQLPSGSGNSMALLENEYQLRREALKNQYAQDLSDAETFHLDKKMADVAYSNGIVQLETETAIKRKGIEEQLNQQKMQMQSNAINAAVGLLNVFAGKSKAAAIAALAIEKGLSIANTFMATQTASQLAYGSQLVVGDPTSMVRAEAARDYTLALGYTTMGLIAATGLAEAFSSGGGGGSYGGGTPSSPIVTQPTGTTQQQVPTNVTIQIQGNVIGEDQWVQDNLIPALNGAIGRNVTVNL